MLAVTTFHKKLDHPKVSNPLNKLVQGHLNTKLSTASSPIWSPRDLSTSSIIFSSFVKKMNFLIYHFFKKGILLANVGKEGRAQSEKHKGNMVFIGGTVSG